MMYFRQTLLSLSASMTLVSGAFSEPPIAGRINKTHSAAPADNAKNPSGVSKKVWSPDGYASADSVTSSIGYSMMKWSLGIGIAAMILALAFSASTGSQHSHTHGHTHGHSH